MKSIKLGCIADDFTGATDLANNLVRSGMKVIQSMGMPTEPLADNTSVDCVVVALKTRTLPVEQAVAQSLQALEWLRAQGAEQIYFKYCSTFDSTAQGNIGQVTEALMKALNTDFTIATPAFPDNGRTVFKGHLFVGEVLLSDSGMQNHPLTPMTDANLVRVLQAQCQTKVGLLDYKVIAQGPEVIVERIKQLRNDGVRIAIVDALSNEDLLRLGPALRTLPLVTAGSGVAIGLPGNWQITPSSMASALPSPTGYQAVVSGSCSLATNRQVQHFIAAGHPSLALDPTLLFAQQARGVDIIAEVLGWAKTHLATSPVLLYSTANPEAVKQSQISLGVTEAGEFLERTLAQVALGLVELGVNQLIVAGGETSGACVQELSIKQMLIGPQIDPGVPWCYGEAITNNARPSIHLTLKSGNFGTDDFFTKAFKVLR